MHESTRSSNKAFYSDIVKLYVLRAYLPGRITSEIELPHIYSRICIDICMPESLVACMITYASRHVTPESTYQVSSLTSFHAINGHDI